MNRLNLASVLTMMLGFTAGCVVTLDATVWRVLHAWEIGIFGGLTTVAIRFIIARALAGEREPESR